MMCMYDEGDGWKVFRSDTRRARKPYRCCECQREISAGEQYEYATGVLNGDDGWLTMRTCQHCAAGPYDWLERVCGGWLYEGAYEDLTEHRHELVADIALLRNIVGMRRKWRRRDGTLMAVPALEHVSFGAAGAVDE